MFKKNIIKTAFILSALFIIPIKPICDRAFVNKIQSFEQSEDPYAKIITLFNNAAIEGFVGSDNLGFIKKGLSKETFKWDQLLECSHGYIKQAIESNRAPKELINDLTKLEKINDVIKRLIQLLHNTFKDFITKPLSQQESDFLRNLIIKLEELEKKLLRMSSSLIKNEASKHSLPEDFYKDSENLSLEKIFPGYKQFFKKYQHALSYFGTTELTPRQLKNFLYTNKLLVLNPIYKNQTILNQYRYTEEDFYNRLNKFTHALKKKIDSRAASRPRFIKMLYTKQSEQLRKMYSDALNIMKNSLEFDSYIIPEYYASRVPASRDVVTIMLIGEINNLVGITEQLIVTLNTLLSNSNVHKEVVTSTRLAKNQLESE